MGCRNAGGGGGAWCASGSSPRILSSFPYESRPIPDGETADFAIARWPSEGAPSESVSEGSKELEILFVEDSETDARLIARELERWGFAPVWERVETVDSLRTALIRRTWGLVISDSSVPRLGVLEALHITHAVDPALPFIVVSGAFREQVARDVMCAGAADWVTKNDLDRLGPVVCRELERRGGGDSSTLGQRLVEAQEGERRHIARALHDELGQVFAVLRLTLSAAQRQRGAVRGQKIAEALTLVEQGAVQLRSVAAGLWPTILDDVGLPAALRWLADRGGQPKDPTTTVDVDDVGRLSFAIEVACFRVVQEALTNAWRHSQANSVAIRMRSLPGGLAIEVEDDGRGFDTEAAWLRAAAGESLGLYGMRERVSLVGGRLDVDSATGSGTRVRAFFPHDRRSGE